MFKKKKKKNNIEDIIKIIDILIDIFIIIFTKE